MKSYQCDLQDEFSSNQIESLSKIAENGVGQAAESLSSLVGAEVQLSVPSLQVCTPAEIEMQLMESNNGFSMLVTQDFSGKVTGRAGLLFHDQSGPKLANILLEGEGVPEDAQEVVFEILLEVGNIILNGLMGSLSNLTRDTLDYGIPSISVGAEILKSFSSIVPASKYNECSTLIIDVKFDVETHQLDGSMMIVFDVATIKSLIADAVFA